MAIRGDLLSVDLSNVFQMLALNRKRGVLSIHNRDNILEQRSLVLQEDRVALLNVPTQVDLNALLVDQGALSYEDCDLALASARTRSQSVVMTAPVGRVAAVEGSVG